MKKQELDNIWNYYLSLETDLANTSRYIEPSGQEDVHSFEFAKLLVLACTEIESVFKMICQSIEGYENAGNMCQYKEAILKKFPKIIESNVSVARLGRQIRPFEEWGQKKLAWWDAYQNVKHSRWNSFVLATYMNATYAISALYVLVFYVASINHLEFTDNESQYIISDYAHKLFSVQPPQKLPDFEGD